MRALSSSGSGRGGVAVIAASCIAFASSQACADTVYYDFSSVPQGTTVTPYTLQGASFGSPGDGNSLVVNSSNPTGGVYVFGGNNGLYSSFGASVSILTTAGNAAFVPLGLSTELDISFAQTQTGLGFQFGIGDFLQSNGGDTLTVTTNGGYSGTVTDATIPAGSNDLFPQGLFNLAGANPFTTVKIVATDNSGPGGAPADEDLAIANLSSTPVPLPASAWLLLGALGGVGVMARPRRRS
jgi:hypothetical protein